MRTPHFETFLALALTVLLGGSIASCTDEQTIDDEEPTDQQEQAGQQPESVEFEEVIDEPGDYQDKWVQGEVTIDSLISDKAFFLSGDEGNRLFAAFHLKGESRADLEPGQQVRLEGQIVGKGEAFERLRQLDVPAPEQLEDESFALLISEADDVEVLSQPPAAEGDMPEEQDQKTMTDVGKRDYGSLDTWDADGDGMVDREEFDQGISEKDVYTDIDTDGDGDLNEDEFYQWGFGLWDENDDGDLTEDEFEAGTDDWDQYEWGAFDDWDSNDDEMLTSTEFTDGADEVGVFDDWDANDDDAIDDDEFSDGLFGLWDENEDDALDDDEWGFEEEQTDEQVRANPQRSE